MKRKLLIGLMPMAGMCATTLASVVVIDYSGSALISETQALGGSGSLLTPGTAISPASGYTGQTFSGGLIATNTTVGAWQIDNDTARGGASMPALDWISASVGSTSGADAKFHRGIVFFQQAEFLDQASLTGGVTLQSLSVAVTRSGGNPSRFGFVIEADGAYFLSSPVTYNQTLGGGFNANFVNGHYLSITDPSAATWLSFDPETSLSTIGAAGTPDLTKVTGAGVWFENERAGTSTAGLGFHMTGINVTAVPEPSTYAAILGLLALGGVMWRRRSR